MQELTYPICKGKVNAMKTRVSAIVLSAIVLVGTMIVISIPAKGIDIRKGTALIYGADLPSLIGIPENNIRFALWNGTIWFELPFSLTRAKVQKTFTTDANGTTITSTVSADSRTICAHDVFSVKIPAMAGVNASSSEWWTKALDLRLFNRLAVQLSDSSSYSCMIFVYFEPSGSSLPPDYSSDYTLPLFGSLVNQTQNQAVGTTALASPDLVAIFNVQSSSAPLIVKMVSASEDPPVYSFKTVLEQKFEDTQSNQQPTSPFYLPELGQNLSGVILKIEWNDVGDQYWRALNAYVNGQIVWTDNNGQGLFIAPGSSSVEKDITNMVSWWSQQGPSWIYNNASVVLTTYAGYGYWNVRAYIYVVYSAATHFVEVASTWTQEYDVQTNTQNTINFPTSLPDSMVDQPSAERFYINAKPDNDPYVRYLDLYIDNAFINRWSIWGESHKSLDVTPYLIGTTSVTIGIQLICGVGTWAIDGNITVLYRPSVAPDVDPYWVSPTNFQTLTSHTGNIYFNYPITYSFAGNFATETKGFGSNPGNGYTYYTGLTAAYPSSTPCYGPSSMQTKICIIEPDGYSVLPNTAYSFQGFGGSPPPSGSTYVSPLQNIGIELLTGASIWLSITDPPLSAFFGFAALITQYATSPPDPPFEAKTDSTGIEMNYNVASAQDAQSMLLKWIVTWPSSGVYTIIIQTTVKMDFGFPTPHATIMFNDTFQQYVPMSGTWPSLTISTTNGGPNPPTYPLPNSYTCSYGCYPMITAYSGNGYGFDHWSLDQNQQYSTNPSVSVTMNSDHLLEAHFNNHYNLTVSSTLWGTTSPYPDFYMYAYGTYLNVTALPWSGCVFDYWTLDGVNYASPNPMPINMTANHSIMAHFHDASGGGGEGRCPTLFSWNGTGYAYYGVIPLHNASGFDVVKEVPVNSSDVGISNYLAQFRLREGWLGLNSSQSVIDQVKLYAVDAYGHRLPCPLINATHGALGNVLPQLLLSDDRRVQITLLQTIDLSFLMPYPTFLVKSYVFVIEGCNQFKQ